MPPVMLMSPPVAVPPAADDEVPGCPAPPLPTTSAFIESTHEDNPPAIPAPASADLAAPPVPTAIVDAETEETSTSFLANPPAAPEP